MFDLEPGDELELLVETARRFAADELAPHAREFEAARSPNDRARAAYAGVPHMHGAFEAIVTGRPHATLGRGEPSAAMAAAVRRRQTRSQAAGSREAVTYLTMPADRGTGRRLETSNVCAGGGGAAAAAKISHRRDGRRALSPL